MQSLLSMYDFEIKYRKGETMFEADCLSRLPIEGETGVEINAEININMINEELPINFEEIENETIQDTFLKQLYSLNHGKWDKLYFYIWQNLKIRNFFPEMKFDSFFLKLFY